MLLRLMIENDQIYLNTLDMARSNDVNFEDVLNTNLLYILSEYSAVAIYLILSVWSIILNIILYICIRELF